MYCSSNYSYITVGRGGRRGLQLVTTTRSQSVCLTAPPGLANQPMALAAALRRCAPGSTIGVFTTRHIFEELVSTQQLSATLIASEDNR